MGDLSPHFSRSEFACHHCGKVIVSDRLVARLEILRAMVGKPLVIVSGYRCPVHNAKVGGAKASQHLVGQAADLQVGYCNWQVAKRAGFTGVGHRSGQVTHVDVRPPPFVMFKD
jgi:uncharacterized protein YcbK (DUF882 family)